MKPLGATFSSKKKQLLPKGIHSPSSLSIGVCLKRMGVKLLLALLLFSSIPTLLKAQNPNNQTASAPVQTASASAPIQTATASIQKAAAPIQTATATAPTSGSTIDLVQADKGAFEKRIDAKKLLGNVILKNDKTLMYCDSAYIYSNNTADAWGKVRIVASDSLNATGDQLHYDATNKMAHLTGEKVILNDKTIVLQTTAIDLDLHNNKVTYQNNAVITNAENQLTSIQGLYYTKTQLFEFHQQVVFTHPGYRINTDTLFYNTKAKEVRVWGPSVINSKNGTIHCTSGTYNAKTDRAYLNHRPHVYSGPRELIADSIFYDQQLSITKGFQIVVVTDSIQHSSATGSYLYDNRLKKFTQLTGKPIYSKITPTDTLYLKADTLQSDNDSTQRIIAAYHHVQIYKHDLQGKCDSLSFTIHDSTIKLYHNPILWSITNQMVAKFISIQLANNQLSTLHLMQAAFIISKQDSDKYNQIKGKTMDAFFANNNLYKVIVTGNGQTIYYAKDKADFVGVNKADCSSLLLYMKDNQIDRISFLTKPDATLFPMKDITPKDLLLKDFKWFPQARPTLQSIFN